MLTLALALLATPDPEAMRQAIIAHCAIAADRLAVEHWEDPLGDVLVVKGDTPLSDAQLKCLSDAEGLNEPDAAAPDVMMALSFEDYALRQRYIVLVSRSNLAERGQLDRLPRFDPSRDTLARFARRLERFCKARPGSLFVVEGDNIRFSDAFFARDDPPEGDMLCAYDALGASGFDPFGVPRPPVLQVTTPVS